MKANAGRSDARSLEWYVWVNNRLEGTVAARTHAEACRLVELRYGPHVRYEIYRSASCSALTSTRGDTHSIARW